jgi:anti-sigma regulatory factor (Ser/Thr protein kinase)
MGCLGRPRVARAREYAGQAYPRRRAAIGGRSRPGNEAAAGVLVREFDADALAGLRQEVLSYATAWGMPEDRAIDVMLAVHELAANAVHHGPGHGRLQLYATTSTLHCEVSDPGLSGRDAPWPVEQGHGLWLVHAIADQIRVTSGPYGSLITVAFALPGTAPS